MNPEIETGGPAFPTKREALDPRATGWHMDEGMTLRDWFAGKALPTHMAIAADGVLGTTAEEIAARVYEMADAMIAARKGGTDGK